METSNRFDDFVRGYITCALWISTDNSRDDGGDPLDKNYAAENIAPETLSKMMADCKFFRERANVLLARAYDEHGFSDSSAGHDLWLTRNGHGAGFWDRGLGYLGDELTEAAKAMGSVDLYVGDDGQIYDS